MVKRRGKTFLGLIISFLIVFSLMTSALQAYDLDVDSAVSMALEYNKSYLTALQDRLKAEGAVREAKAGAFPSLTFKGNYIRNLELPEIVFADQKFKVGTNNNYSLSFNLDQTLFDPRLYNAVAIAKLYGEYSDEGVKIARQQVIYGTKQYFFSAILARDNVSVYEDAVKTAEENFKVVQSQYDQGLVSEYDKLSAEVDLANLRPQLVQSQNNAETVLSNLKYFIGYEGFDTIDLDFEFNIEDTIPTPDLQESIDKAIANRPDYVGQDYLIKAYKKAIGVARSGRLPSLYFSAAVEWSAAIDKNIPNSKDWTRSADLQLNLSFPLFDGFKTSGAVKQAKADHVKSSLTKQQIKDGILVEVEEAIGSIKESKKRLASGEKTIALAEEGLRVANLRFKNGVGTQLEIISAQAALTKAKTNYFQAIYDYEISIAKYDKAVGLDQPDIRRE
jgi:outer membrane protein